MANALGVSEETFTNIARLIEFVEFEESKENQGS